MNKYTVDKPSTARVERRCTNTTSHPGCGRWIKKGEQYHKVKTGGIGDFVICTWCYKNHKS
jgi:hypothetical protein